MPLIEAVKERKLGQWALAYLSGAWLVWEVADNFGARWGNSAWRIADLHDDPRFQALMDEHRGRVF